jgi:hypothetical protein
MADEKHYDHFCKVIDLFVSSFSGSLAPLMIRLALCLLVNENVMLQLLKARRRLDRSNHF